MEWKIGIEADLMVPPGGSRLSIALALAEGDHGSVRVVLHQDSEPNRVRGLPPALIALRHGRGWWMRSSTHCHGNYTLTPVSQGLRLQTRIAER